MYTKEERHEIYKKALEINKGWYLCRTLKVAATGIPADFTEFVKNNMNK